MPRLTAQRVTVEPSAVSREAGSTVKLPMAYEQKVVAGVVIALFLFLVGTTITKIIDAFRLNGLIYGVGYGVVALGTLMFVTGMLSKKFTLCGYGLVAGILGGGILAIRAFL
jgi:hypothetical protein